ncbi:hypothetical protein L228DRAFT_285706 [Xylona heveae TC161]|uniref:Uncharacterized protein n=1 Tax=Xylona heveae (strain CBS 132557 / TC161) TaxID=1328760 RepID=A0A165A0B7_XYLHT|nr:hypothetical protein L228DRAFT_285706 [Xylona heveae TC161]KZF19769.1 hypothetical protein L228DRAFT_285706 [Xylona heveae TC161]
MRLLERIGWGVAVLVLLTCRAQADDAHCDDSIITIQNQRDATAIENCTTISGQLVLDSSISGSIVLSGVERINGPLTSQGTKQLVSFSAHDLRTVGGELQFANATILTTLNFQNLRSVEKLTLSNLPSLQKLDLAAPLQSASSVALSNTNLSTVTKGLGVRTVDVLNVTNNPNLANLSMPLFNVTESMLIAGNNNNMMNLSLPNLEWAFAMNVTNCSVVNMPSLSTVNETLSWVHNPIPLLSFPNLTAVAGVLDIEGSYWLNSLSMPKLTIIEEDFIIKDNPNLHNISGLQSLNSTSSINFEGNFSSVELPSLATVYEYLIIESTSSDLNCTFFQRFKDQSLTNWTCTGDVSNSTIGMGSGDSSDSGSHSSGLSSGAKAGIAVGVVVFVAILAVGIFFFVRRKTRYSPVAHEKGDDKEHTEVHGGHRSYEQSVALELDGQDKADQKPKKPVELTGSTMAHELEA